MPGNIPLSFRNETTYMDLELELFVQPLIHLFLAHICEIFILFIFLRKSLVLMRRLECSGGIMADCSLNSLGSVSLLTSSWDHRHVLHPAWLIFYFYFMRRWGSHCVS